MACRSFDGGGGRKRFEEALWVRPSNGPCVGRPRSADHRPADLAARCVFCPVRPSLVAFPIDEYLQHRRTSASVLDDCLGLDDLIRMKGASLCLRVQQHHAKFEERDHSACSRRSVSPPRSGTVLGGVLATSTHLARTPVHLALQVVGTALSIVSMRR